MLRIMGRNERCYCNSGLRFKNCHGELKKLEAMSNEINVVLKDIARAEKVSEQRTAQQGFGRPIISVKTKDERRIVIVNNRIYSANGWNTFHEFLLDHLWELMGQDWVEEQLRRPVDERHPILIWRQKYDICKDSIDAKDGEVVNVPLTGAIAALIHIAYDMYALDHNADLQKKLVNRLRNQDQFIGAHYEVQVTAMLARAGFGIEFEDEDDRTSRHCEFTATHLQSGKKFSVEAKKNTGGRDNSTRHVSRALGKDANHTRIIFVDLNSPEPPGDGPVPEYAKHAIRQLRNFERTQPHAQELDHAYIFLTNSSFEHHLDDADCRHFAIKEGFRIDDFKMDYEFPSLCSELDAWERHKEMHDLRRSISMHADVPVTFDAHYPLLAFGNAASRPAIGKNYTVKNKNGIDTEARLISAEVLEGKKIVVCTLIDVNNKKIVIERSFSEVELAIWKEDPSSYFKEHVEIKTVGTRAEMYEHYMEKSRSMSKLELLAAMRKEREFEKLHELEHSEILKLFCVRMTEIAAEEMGPPPKISFYSFPQRRPS